MVAALEGLQVLPLPWGDSNRTVACMEWFQAGPGQGLVLCPQSLTNHSPCLHRLIVKFPSWEESIPGKRSPKGLNLNLDSTAC